MMPGGIISYNQIMEFTAAQIAAFLHGEIQGNAEVKVHNVTKIEEGEPGTLSFMANPKYEKYLYTSKSSIILINKDLQLKQPVSATLIRVDNAYEAFAALLQLYEQSKAKSSGISSLCSIDKTAVLGAGLYIGDFAVISGNVQIGNNTRIYPQVYIGENAKIGDNTTLYPGVKVYHDCIIGSGCIIHAGTVIGSDGFGFASMETGEYKKIPQLGNVVIEDDVELGSNVSVDRATMGSTFIRKGVKLDNLIQVAHNVDIGEHTVIAAQSGIAGSAKIGARCMFGGQVAINGHISIADDIKIGAQSGVANNIAEKGGMYLGTPVQKISSARRAYAIFVNLPTMFRDLYQLKREVEEHKKTHS